MGEGWQPLVSNMQCIGGAKPGRKPEVVTILLSGNLSQLFQSPKAYATEEEFEAAHGRPGVQSLPLMERLRSLFSVPASSSKYDAGAPLRTLFKLQGTAVLRCLHRPEFWLLLAFHTAVSLLYYRASGHTSSLGVATAENWPKAHVSLVSIPGSLLVFSLVFYINQTYLRYHRQYMHCKGAVTALGEVVLYLRTTFGDGAFEAAPAVRLHLCKLLNAALALGFAGLPQLRGVGLHFFAYRYLLETGLLTPGQVDHVKGLVAFGEDGRLGFKEVMGWLFRSLWAQVEQGHLRDKVATKYSTILFEMERHLAKLYAYSEGPMPYVYYNHLNVILLVYLFLLSYTFVFQTAYYTIPAFFLILLAFISARELGDMLSDPFGDDALDIPVFDLVEESRHDTMELIGRTPFKATLPGYLLQTDDAYHASLRRESSSQGSFQGS